MHGSPFIRTTSIVMRSSVSIQSLTSLRKWRNLFQDTRCGRSREEKIGSDQRAIFGISGASVAKHHAAQGVAQTLGFFRIRSVAKLLGELEEFLLFALIGFDAVFNQLDQHAIGAELACLGQTAHLSGGFCGQRDALPHSFALGFHNLILHHSAPICTKQVRGWSGSGKSSNGSRSESSKTRG